MSNAKQTLTTLLSNITAAFSAYPEEDQDLFRSNFNGALDLSTTFQTQINGHTNTTIINSLRSTLQAVSHRTTSSETAIGAWNPIIAAVFNTLEGVILEGETLDISSRLRDTGLNSNHNQSSGQKKKITTTGGLTPRPSQNAKPVVKQPAKVTPSKPVTTSVTLSTCPNDTASRVKRGFERDSKTNAVFKNLPHIKCVTPNCTFCVNLWMALELTKCSEIKCHRKGTVCHRDGWYAHVFPTMWLAAKLDHDAGLPFPGLSKYAPKTSVESTVVKAPLKRPVTYADAVADCPDMDISPHSPSKRSAYDYATDQSEANALWDFHEQDDSVLSLSSPEEGELN